MIDTLRSYHRTRNAVEAHRSPESWGKQMCGKSAVKLLKFETLTGRQKDELKRELRKRRDAVQARLNEVNQALNFVEGRMRRKKKSKR